MAPILALSNTISSGGRIFLGSSGFRDSGTREEPERKQKNGADQLEDKFQRKTHEFEGQQKQPNEGEENERDQGQWPADHQQHKPEYERNKDLHRPQLAKGLPNDSRPNSVCFEGKVGRTILLPDNQVFTFEQQGNAGVARALPLFGYFR